MGHESPLTSSWQVTRVCCGLRKRRASQSGWPSSPTCVPIPLAVTSTPWVEGTREASISLSDSPSWKWLSSLCLDLQRSGLLVSQGCCNKLPNERWLETTETYYLIVWRLEVWILGVNRAVPPEGPRGKAFLAFPGFHYLLEIICIPLLPIFASIIAWPSPPTPPHVSSYILHPANILWRHQPYLIRGPPYSNMTSS